MAMIMAKAPSNQWFLASRWMNSKAPILPSCTRLQASVSILQLCILGFSLGVVRRLGVGTFTGGPFVLQFGRDIAPRKELSRQQPSLVSGATCASAC